MLLAFLAVILTVTFGYCARTGDACMLSEQIQTIEDVKKLFPHSPEEIEKDTEKYLAEAQEGIDAIIAIPAEKRTFANTAKAIDDLTCRGNLAVKGNIFEVIELLHPDKAFRDAAQQAQKKIHAFYIDQISNNKKLYEAFKAYAEGNARNENLNDEERYFIDESMKDFKRLGLDLPEEKLAEVRKLKKELVDLVLQFDRNVAEDARTVSVEAKDLKGVPADFIERLPKADDGKCIVGMDYPTYLTVMENCIHEPTRKCMYEAFSSRAHPANDPLLKNIIALRDRIAKLIGFESYAALDVDSQMVKDVARADAFIKDLHQRANKKADQELDSYIEELPESVSLYGDNQVKAWDGTLLQTVYKRRKFNIDEEKIAEYFPIEHTIQQLLDIYRQFLSVDFEETPVSGLWHEDVKLIKVFNKDRSQLYGYLFLDLYPRPSKYKHAAHAGMAPALKCADGSRLPAVSVVIANFTKPTKDKPSLLKRDEVKTFFHEFGHAMHAFLGATQLGSFAGTHVKTDFVELPSQMLEEWLGDRDILKKVSHHYKTGEPLPDAVIDNILALKHYASGSFITRQAMLAQYSLDLHKSGASKDPYAILHELLPRVLPRVYYGPEYRLYANFGHLTGYGAKYYGYLWSKVFALDIFDTIKKHGLLNPEIGQRYVQEVIGKGGSADPNQLLKNFLGREPRQDAFMKDMGLAD